MREKEMDRLMQHFNTYFQHRGEPKVIHPIVMEPHIDALLYEPNEVYPYWKLVTMGASDHRMRVPRGALGNRNEYIMFISPDEDMKDAEVAYWYFNRLMETASYSIDTGVPVSYGHSMEWQRDGEEEMVGAYLELPRLVEDTGILRCKLGFMKTAICLQVVLLTRAEIDRLLEIGPEAFSGYLYPEDLDAPYHFLCERSRSEKF